MKEDRNKFYLYDRWFYIIKEDDEKIYYSSNPEDQLNGITIELEKQTKCMNILYFEDNELKNKMTVSDITKDEIILNYKDQEPQEIKINNNLYVNLLLDATIKIASGRRTPDDKIIVTRKRTLHKMCYCEPDFPTDEEIPLSAIVVDSKILDYSLELSTFIVQFSSKMKKIMDEKPVEKTEDDQNTIR